MLYTHTYTHMHKTKHAYTHKPHTYMQITMHTSPNVGKRKTQKASWDPYLLTLIVENGPHIEYDHAKANVSLWCTNMIVVCVHIHAYMCVYI